MEVIWKETPDGFSMEPLWVKKDTADIMADINNFVKNANQKRTPKLPAILQLYPDIFEK